MPTTGWILEGAQDRYWEGTAHLAQPQDFNLACPFCSRQFQNHSTLAMHLGIEHPVGIPLLLLTNRPVARRMVVRRTPDPKDFLVHNCTECVAALPGGVTRMFPGELPDWLCSKLPTHVDIELINTRANDHRAASSSYLVEFRIPTNELLDECDRLFVERLVVPQPTMGDVDSYRRAIPGDASVREYAGALADYVVGILLKEQARDRGVQGGFESYKDKFMEALSVLGDFPRRLPKVVATAIEFNLNAWERISPPSQLHDFARAVEFFRLRSDTPKGTINEAEMRVSEKPICPLDIVTDRILNVVQRLLFSGDLTHEDHLVGIESLQSRVPVGEFDMVKMHVISAVSGLWQKDQRLSTEHLRKIQFDVKFGDWARTKLKELGDYE